MTLGLLKPPDVAGAALAAFIGVWFGLFPDFAMARDVNLGSISKGQLQSACKAAGGSYGEGEGMYVCTTNCSAKGHCQVACDKSGCKGSTPNNSPSRGAGTLGGVLSGSAGTASAAGGTASNKKPPLHNVNQPVVIQHSGGARSGGSKHEARSKSGDETPRANTPSHVRAWCLEGQIAVLGKIDRSWQ